MAKIEGLDAADRTALTNHHLPSTEEIWKGLAENAGLIDSFALPAADKTRMLRALAAEAKRQSESITKGKIAIHTPDLIVGIAVVALIVGAMLIKRNPQVIATKPLSPFHVVNTKDVEIRFAADAAKANTALAEYIGRYPTAQVASGEVLDSTRLSSGPPLADELNGLRIFTLKVRPTSVLSGVKPPVKLDLFFSPHSREDQGKAQLFSVYALDFRSDGDNSSVVAAAAEDDAKRLLSVISQGDLIVLGRTP
ncbi:MAG TPA: hypothetical protein VI685_16265 [Candidatus Angelobacter sp.]